MRQTRFDQWLPTVALVAMSVLVTYAATFEMTRVRTTETMLRQVEERTPWWSVEDFRSESSPFVSKYGPARSSQWYEEFLIRDYFNDRRGGVFLDVGANHYKETSNTYFLEVSLGWSGIAIEPQTQFAADYATYRPRTAFVAMFASDVPGQKVQLFTTPGSNRMASAVREFTEKAGPTTPVSVPTTTLDDVLAQAGITTLDFVTMDIELHEPRALAGFDLRRFKPALVCVEAHALVRQQILDYFQARSYAVVGKYLRVDPKNLYFQPAQAQ